MLEELPLASPGFSEPLDWWQQTFPQGRQLLQIEDANGDEVSIAYGTIGSGQPLLLLHGIGSWSYNWRFSIPALAQHFRVICLDAKGYGFSQSYHRSEQVGHQVRELGQMIQQVADRPVWIAAESLGALTALALAQTAPELIDRLIVINVPIFPHKLPSFGMQFVASLPLPIVRWVDQQRWIRPFAPIVKAVTRQIRREVVVDPTQTSEVDLYWLTYPYLNLPGSLTQFATDLQLAAREIQRYHQGQPNWISTIQQNLARIHCPTLVLWSDCDRWFPPTDGQRLADQLPNAQFQLIPNCGHVASSGNPTAVNAAILRFADTEILSQIDPG
ncbi:MAG: alpha/beta hydrolase [Elainella sp. Prado103]|jgi:pimeloyl-ACP methyl ester carboxylesterase|nr:alpha/beta hydrolase [Elainella sp. Prado103]